MTHCSWSSFIFESSGENSIFLFKKFLQSQFRQFIDTREQIQSRSPSEGANTSLQWYLLFITQQIRLHLAVTTGEAWTPVWLFANAATR